MRWPALLILVACWTSPIEVHTITQSHAHPPSTRHTKYTCHQIEQLFAEDFPKEPDYSACIQFSEMADFYWCLYSLEQLHTGALHWWIDIAAARCADEEKLR